MFEALWIFIKGMLTMCFFFLFIFIILWVVLGFFICSYRNNENYFYLFLDKRKK